VHALSCADSLVESDLVRRPGARLPCCIHSHFSLRATAPSDEPLLQEILEASGRRSQMVWRWETMYVIAEQAG